MISMAPGPHPGPHARLPRVGARPRRELTPMPRCGFAWPLLGTPPPRGCRAGGPGMAAGAAVPASLK